MRAFRSNISPLSPLRVSNSLPLLRSVWYSSPASKPSSENERFHDALQALGCRWDRTEIWSRPRVLCRVLQLFTKQKDVAAGRHVQTLMADENLDSHAFLGNHLVRLFSECQSLGEATHAFRRIASPDAHSWTAIISAHTKLGQGEEAFQLYCEMLRSNVKPNPYVYVAALNACASMCALEYGRFVHRSLVQSPYAINVYVNNALIDMYAKCGRVDEAHRIFESLVNRDVVSWNTMIVGYTLQGLSDKAFLLYDAMLEEHIQPDVFTFTSVLKVCANGKLIDKGKVIHDQVVKSGLESNVLVGNALMDMYVKCGSLGNARKVLEELPRKNIASWSTMISGYASHEQAELAFELFNQMQDNGMQPDNIIFANLLKMCTQMCMIDKGKEIHAQIARLYLELDALVGNTLVEMYARVGMLDLANTVFGKLNCRKVTSWNALIMGYGRSRLGQRAFQMFASMQLEGLSADATTLVGILKACGTEKDLNQGRLIHQQLAEKGFGSDLLIGNSLVSMYLKCGSLVEARKVFDQFQVRDSVLWTTMISGYAQGSSGQEALALFKEMQASGVKPETLTWVNVLNACTSIKALEHGRCIHAEILKNTTALETQVRNAIVNLYLECERVDEACQVFEELSEKDKVTWCKIISGLAQHGLSLKALEYFKRMQLEGLCPDGFTFVNLLKGCESMSSLSDGILMHDAIRKSGLESDPYVGTALVTMYSKLGHLVNARQAFESIKEKDVACWNAMISGLALHGLGAEALQLFQEMQKDGLKPSAPTFLSALKASSSIGAVDQVKLIHKQIIESGLEGDRLVRNSLLDSYCGFGCISEARQVFDSMMERDLISWGTMIVGYAKHGFCEKALECFDCMQTAGMKPDGFIFASALKACAAVSDIERGKSIHAQIEHTNYSDPFVGNALVDMYAKCGSLVEARRVFEKFPRRDVVSFNGMIGAYAQHGYGLQALQLLKEMKEQGLKPTEATVSAVLNACSHARLISEALYIFQNMHNEFGITPNVQHITCIVDLLGRAGKLHRAEDLIKEMPTQPDSVVWMSLLGACRTYGNLELGRRAFESVLKVSPTNIAAYIMMSNIYAKAGKWKEMGVLLRAQEVSCPVKIP